MPHDDAPAEEHRASVAWLCLTLLRKRVDAGTIEERLRRAVALLPGAAEVMRRRGDVARS